MTTERFPKCTILLESNRRPPGGKAAIEIRVQRKPGTETHRQTIRNVPLFVGEAVARRHRDHIVKQGGQVLIRRLLDYRFVSYERGSQE